AVFTQNGQPVTGTQASFSFTPDDNGTYAVSLTVSNGLSTDVTKTKTLMVGNVAPTVSIHNPPGSGTPNLAITLQADVTDPGSADTHTFAWSVQSDNGQVVPGGVGQSFSFTPTAAGNYTVSVQATDDDGASSAAASTSIVVAPTALTVKINPQGTAQQHATAQVGTAAANNLTLYTAVAAGDAGNAISIAYVKPGLANQPLSVAVSGTDIKV